MQQHHHHYYFAGWCIWAAAVHSCRSLHNNTLALPPNYQPPPTNRHSRHITRPLGLPSLRRRASVKSSSLSSLSLSSSSSSVPWLFSCIHSRANTHISARTHTCTRIKKCNRLMSCSIKQQQKPLE
ncbi:unnamed protein product [Ceratitis capitata]|uniref:(Mediterranean fruit fly) hypothetical protein n=1 Tax=Ceratitis capitata TaxID=7213 RepID=A0A811VHA8_CERCA|nr:unnamed protein product [Ceratitis capitata]